MTETKKKTLTKTHAKPSGSTAHPAATAAKKKSAKSDSEAQPTRKSAFPKKATPEKTQHAKKSENPRRAKLTHTTHLSAESARASRQWYIVDATGHPVGRLSTVIATYLRGKHKPEYSTHLDCGDYIIVTHAKAVKLSGKKWKDKKYFHHTGYMGHMRETNAETLRQKSPEDIIKLAVKGMLPHTHLGKKMFKKLRVYAGATHEHEAQNPQPLKL